MPVEHAREEEPAAPAPARAPMLAALRQPSQVASVLALQRSIGNAAVSRLLARQQAACPARPPDESARSRAEGILAGDDTEYVDGSPAQLIIRDFAVNAAAPPAGVTRTPAWERAVSLMIGDPTTRIAITGMTDCVGSANENLDLRDRRAGAVRAMLPPPLQSRVLLGGPGAAFFDTNDTPEGRARNRAVKVTWISDPASGRQATDYVRQARNMDEYMFLVREMERRLGIGGAGDARRAISLLRQMYYGNTSGGGGAGGSWSNSPNPVWDWVIPDRPWGSAVNPSQQMGAALMQSLQRSQVVDGVDMGHVLTGIDAMLNPAEVLLRFGRVSVGSGLVNEEWATWAGDVGSAAAYWALDAWGARGGRAPGVAATFQRYAGASDLRGNIEAYAIRAALTSTAGTAQRERALDPTLPFSEMLMQYHRITTGRLGTAARRPIRNFVEAYGGVIVNGAITNPDVVRGRLEQSVGVFAHLLFFQEAIGRGYLADQPPPLPPGVSGPAELLLTGVREMTDQYMAWLRNQLTAEGP